MTPDQIFDKLVEILRADNGIGIATPNDLMLPTARQAAAGARAIACMVAAGWNPEACTPGLCEEYQYENDMYALMGEHDDQLLVVNTYKDHGGLELHAVLNAVFGN